MKIISNSPLEITKTRIQFVPIDMGNAKSSVLGWAHKCFKYQSVQWPDYILVTVSELGHHMSIPPHETFLLAPCGGPASKPRGCPACPESSVTTNSISRESNAHCKLYIVDFREVGGKVHGSSFLSLYDKGFIFDLSYLFSVF